MNSLSTNQPEEFPQRLEAGTLPLSAIFGLNAAQKWLCALGRKCAHAKMEINTHHDLCKIAVQYIHTVLKRKRALLESTLRSINGVTVYGPAFGQPSVSTLALNIADLDAESAVGILDADYHICARSGLHCAPMVHEDEGTTNRRGALRLSPGFFSDDEDIEQAIRGITELASYP